MTTDDCSNVRHASVTDFYRITIENFVELTSPWEVLVDKGEKTFSDVGFDCLAIWWIEPYNIALSFAAFIPIIRFWGVEFQFMFVSVLYDRTSASTTRETKVLLLRRSAVV